MKKIFLFFFLLSILPGFGQDEVQVQIPAFKDKYCSFIRQLEAGETDIDYQEFRFSFIESKQFPVASGRMHEFDSLQREMYKQMNLSAYPEIIKITKQMLSIDYTSMIAHKILRQTYKAIGDTVNAAKYKSIQFGLLHSIIDQGDGMSCKSSWPVIQISEEYFILQMIGAELLEQSIDREKGLCDKMIVEVDGEKKTYYFETTQVFKGYKKLGF